MNLANERRKKLKELLDYCNAVMESMVFSARGDDVWRHSSYYEYARKYNELIEYLKQVIDRDIPIGCYDLSKMKTPVNTIAIEQKSIFDSVHTNLSIVKA